MIRAAIVLTTLTIFAVQAFAEGPRTFGDAMPAGPSQSLAEAIEALDAEAVSNLKLEGTITKVCKKKGCWMVLTDGDVYARVTFKDYGFFVPTDSGGLSSTVYGELQQKTLSRKEARHFAKDEGADPKQIKGDVVEYAIVASAVEIN